MTPCAQSLTYNILNLPLFFFFFLILVICATVTFTELNQTDQKLLGYNPVYAHGSKGQQNTIFQGL